MIRRAREEDASAALALWREADAHHATLAPSHFRAGERAPREWRALVTEEGAGIFVAEGAEGVVGLGVVRVFDTPPDPALVPRRRGHVEVVVVAKAARRRGLGRALMAELASWARRQGARELVLTVWDGNADAEAFYERLGYAPLSRALRAPL
jgi:ribosomal protein S18 acetylase RimI-like enzyme